MRWESKQNHNVAEIEEVRRIPPSSILLIGMLLMLTIYLLYPNTYLTAGNPRTAEIYMSWLIRPGEEFSVSYTHSVELTEVREVYRAMEDGILLIEERFKSYGAGLPADAPYPFKITDAGFVYYDINKLFSEVIYRTGAVKAEHRLLIGGIEYPFLAFSEPAAEVELKISGSNRLFMLMRRCK